MSLDEIDTVFPIPFDMAPPAEAIDIFTGRQILADASKFDLVALMRKHRHVEPIRRRI